MKWPRTQRFPPQAIRFFQSVLLVAALCACTIGVPLVEAKERTKFDTEREYIAYPGNIPSFRNFSTPQMVPGDKRMLNFSITNRYEEEMRNIRLWLEIYHQARIDESENISGISEPPYFLSSGNMTLFITFGIIESNATAFVNAAIKSKTGTREGTYFVRTSLSFRYSNTTYHMKSRAHFSKELWDKATSDEDDHETTGAINLTTLEVDGIIPETTFGVRKPIVIWPIYVFAALAAFFAGLAIFVYLLEEEAYPRLNKRVEEHRRKLNELWFSLKNRKGKT